MRLSLARRAVVEFVGTAFLVAAVIGSGIMGERLAGGNIALALLCNTIATGAALVALILALGPISGAHFNPVVTMCDALDHGLPWDEVPAYVVAQVSGGGAGAVGANLMFGLPAVFLSQHARAGSGQLLGELIATFGLLCVIWGCSRFRSTSVAFAVGAYITSAYWFTSSTSFVNPAVTVARSLSDTFAGIRPRDVAPFMLVQVCGGVAATILFRFLSPSVTLRAKELLITHERDSESGVQPGVHIS